MNATQALSNIKVAIEGAPRNSYIAELHVQIIKYADVLQNVTGKEFCEELGIGSSFGTEFAKMRKIVPRLRSAGLHPNRLCLVHFPGPSAVRLPYPARRLADLLIDPHETPDVEIKGWLDISTPDHQAKLAKGIIALANHGGGYILIGFDEVPGYPAQPAVGRPASLTPYNRDRINGVVDKYVDPPVHCDVH